MEEDHLAEARLREDVSSVVASGNASDNATIAEVAKVSPNTANKLATTYIGPLMRRRNEHDDHLPLTQVAVYRWCGLHARYIVSWCRRNRHADVLDRRRSQLLGDIMIVGRRVRAFPLVPQPRRPPDHQRNRDRDGRPHSQHQRYADHPRHMITFAKKSIRRNAAPTTFRRSQATKRATAPT